MAAKRKRRHTLDDEAAVGLMTFITLGLTITGLMLGGALAGLAGLVLGLAAMALWTWQRESEPDEAPVRRKSRRVREHEQRATSSEPVEDEADDEVEEDA